MYVLQENIFGIGLTIIHLAIFTAYNYMYYVIRQNRSYTKGERELFVEMPTARKITKIAFALNFISVLTSFWVPHHTEIFHLGFISTSWSIKFIGLLITFLSYLFLQSSLKQLGENYSPLFDSHRPQFIVRTGSYKYIRHPVYLANMLIILGYFIASASVWSLLCSLWGWGYMLWTINKEESYLVSQFADYQEYKKRSWRLIPYIY